MVIEQVRQKEFIHFIGIGGAGMSGLAKLLLERGYTVSGSDLAANETTKKLSSLGAAVFKGHRPEHLLPAVKRVVISSAIKETNPELQKARELGIPVIRRGELLAELLQQGKGIAVAGSHGKTTTSSMIAWCLEKNGWDPTVVVGGEVNNIGENAKQGLGEYMVVEADESDGSFLKLRPYIGVVTNVEDDHLDYYGSFDNLVKAFADFLAQVSPGGFAVVCNDSPVLQALIKGQEKTITYGFDDGADYRAVQLELTATRSKATIQYKGTYLGVLELTVPGKHNIYNALAALAVCLELGLSFRKTVEALATFKGAKRRFQLLGTAREIKVVDDYAHHPTEVMATLEAARQLNPRFLWAVFQPHRFSRTKQLFQEFGKAFKDADQVIVTDIYAAGESPIPGVSAEMIVEAAQAESTNVLYLAGFQEIVAYLKEHCRPGDLVLTLGAGDIWQVGLKLLQKLQD
ncbi:MAG: UDP-N-acetylmuramate--L-alanine ligase [Clostridia bacterium]|nr:UDP-N-acetylmuramate--L-alanine ligase [Clostridia bacterium]